MSLILFINISILLTVTLSLIVAVFSFPQLTNTLKILSLLTIFTLINDLILYYTSSHGIRNIWLVNLFTILEFASLSLIYCFVLKETKFIQSLATALIIALFAIVYITINQSFYLHLNSAAMAIESILMIILSVICFYQMLNKMEYENPLSNPLFWFNAAVLIYFSGGFFFFIFSQSKAPFNIWYIHNLIRLIYTTLILITFWKARKVQILS